MTTSCPLGGCPASRDLAAEVERLRGALIAAAVDLEDTGRRVRDVLWPEDAPETPVKAPRTGGGDETDRRLAGHDSGPQNAVQRNHDEGENR